MLTLTLTLTLTPTPTLTPTRAHGRSNLAFESQHLLHAVQEAGIKNWVSLSEGQQGSLGWLTTAERKARAFRCPHSSLVLTVRCAFVCAATNVPARARGAVGGQDRHRGALLLDRARPHRGQDAHPRRALELLRGHRGAQDHLWQGARVRIMRVLTGQPSHSLTLTLPHPLGHRYGPPTRGSCTASRTICASPSSWRSSAASASSRSRGTATSAPTTT